MTSSMLILSLAVETSEAACPLCQHLSHRVHSHYTRTLADLPCTAKALRLLIRVRRFFCENEACARKIFVERLPELTNVSARRTTRSKERLAELGFALGGKAAAELSAFLGLESSRMTILRILRKKPVPTSQTPRMLGVDEFAYRRGKRYGTILIHLEDGKPVDLLPDRQAVTLETWLKKHPGVQLISRDRAGEFARGASQGARSARCKRLIASMSCAIWQKWSKKSEGSHRQELKTIHLVTTPASSASPLLRHRASWS